MQRGRRSRFRRSRPLLRLGLSLYEPHLPGFCGHFHLSRLQHQAPVAVYLHHRGGGAHAGQLHPVSGHNRPGRSLRLRSLLPQVQGLLGGVHVLPHRYLCVVDGLEICLLLHFPAQLVQLGEYFVHLLLGLPHNAPGLVFTLTPGVFLGLFHLLPEGPCLSGILLALLPQPVRLTLGLFQPLALLLQLGQHILKADGLAVHLRLGGGDDLLIQSQPPGDGKGVGLSGDADEQPISRPQGGHVKLAAGVLHPR